MMMPGQICGAELVGTALLVLVGLDMLDPS